MSYPNQNYSQSPRFYDKKVVKLVQGGADAFIEGSIDTHADKQAGKCLLVHAMEFEPDPSWEVDGSVEVQLNARSAGSALLAIDDKDQITRMKLDRRLTTSGTFEAKTPIPFGKPFEIFADKLYVAFDSVTTGLTATVYVTLWVDEIVERSQVKLRRAWY